MGTILGFGSRDIVLFVCTVISLICRVVSNVCTSPEMSISIGCDDYLGSDKVVDKCGICGGDNTACRVISGVFKHSLTNLGYHKIVEIPEGATKINITEMSCVGQISDASSLFNKQEKSCDFSKRTARPVWCPPSGLNCGSQNRSCHGTIEPGEKKMIHQQPNPGIHYEYIIPGSNTISSQVPLHRRPGEPFNGQLDMTETVNYEDKDLHQETVSHPRQPGMSQPGRFPSQVPDNQVPVGQPPRRSREHNWKQTGTTECSATWAQYPIFRCVHRNTHEEVADSYCDVNSKPTPEEEPCNLFPCPAFWDLGEWSECSKSCGLGMQHRQVLCRQVYANRTLTVQLHRCQHLEKPETTSTCQLKICSEWQIRTEWTSCSVPCGVGQKTRDVKCVSNLGDIVDDEECNMKLRPNDIENCDMGPCAKSWFLTEWSDRVRLVIYGNPYEKKKCSIECGSGTQQREVVCIQKTENHFEMLNPHECAFLQRPPSQQTCNLKPCGFRIREVRCLSDDMSPSTKCDSQLKLVEKESCNTQDCLPDIEVENLILSSNVTMFISPPATEKSIRVDLPQHPSFLDPEIDISTQITVAFAVNKTSPWFGEN
ncbi:hypothetical protein Chor_014681 [Crotalus horridus]